MSHSHCSLSLSFSLLITISVTPMQSSCKYANALHRIVKQCVLCCLLNRTTGHTHSISPLPRPCTPQRRAIWSYYPDPRPLLLLLLLAGALSRSPLVVMLRRVLVVAGLAQLSRASSSLARTQCRHLLLASRSRPSACPLGKPWLHNGTKPLHCLSAAHCFSSSTTTTSTTVRATLSPSIILKRVSMQVSH